MLERRRRIFLHQRCLSGGLEERTGTVPCCVYYRAVINVRKGLRPSEFTGGPPLIWITLIVGSVGQCRREEWREHTRLHARMHAHIHAYARAHARTHSLARMHARTHSPTRRRVRTHTHAHVRTHTRMHARTHTHKHTRVHGNLTRVSECVCVCVCV